jgi:hypothetical protein
MNDINKSPALERWRQSFDANPESAITDLLAGRINLGPYNRARPADALLQLLLKEEDKD